MVVCCRCPRDHYHVVLLNYARPSRAACGVTLMQGVTEQDPPLLFNIESDPGTHGCILIVGIPALFKLHYGLVMSPPIFVCRLAVIRVRSHHFCGSLNSDMDGVTAFVPLQLIFSVGWFLEQGPPPTCVLLVCALVSVDTA